jgi:NitT/TauT family transport system permease protein
MTAISALLPNRAISARTLSIMVAGQLAIFALFWIFATEAVIPKPWDVAQSLGELWRSGVAQDLLTSLVLYIEATAVATLFSLTLSYASAVPFFRPIAEAWSKLRFLGLVGLPFFFTLYVHGVHALKLALLAFSISVFLVTGMLDVLDSIPSEKFDLARTLRMGEWQVVWEVMVLGRIDVAFDVVRQNAAVGWMMLPMVEGLFKSEGGIGAVMDVQNHHFALSTIAAIQLLILGLGLAQDYGFGVVKNVACPYAKLILERR